VVAIRLGMITRTPWEWDEPVYTQISQGVINVGYPTIRPDPGQPQAPYFFHPPFHFFALGAWYQLLGDSSILTSRLFSALVGVLTVIVAMLLVHSLTKNMPATLLSGLLLGVDGWFTYSSSLTKLDTADILVGLTGMWLFQETLKRKSLWWGVAAGVFIGGAGVYKHLGLVFLAAVALHWVLTRQQHRRHALVLFFAVVVVAGYFRVMTISWGDVFTRHTTIQFNRSTGEADARGLNYGVTEAVKALYSTYWAFAGTILAVGVGALLSARETFRHIFRRLPFQLPSVLVCWCLAATVMLVLIRLRNPHYLVYLIVPAVCLVGIAVVTSLQSSTRLYVYRLSTALLVCLFGLHMMALFIRAIVFDQTNAFRETQEYILANVNQDAVILSEEPVCALVPNPCFRFGVNTSPTRVAAVNPTYVVSYTSTTQRPPQTPAILELLTRGQPMFATRGWKEDITVLYLAAQTP
jgi:4-amino-4-deoxy-L-arabinose transferase-like glycosyltransferase